MPSTAQFFIFIVVKLGQVILVFINVTRVPDFWVPYLRSRT